MLEKFMMLFICFFSFSYIRNSTALDSLAPNQSIQHGETLVSSGATFELGFFNPGNSIRQYLGIWYKDVSPLTVVWVANREKPLFNTSGVLKLDEEGVLLILNGTSTNSSVWSSNKSSKVVISNPIAQLLDSGNLVVKNAQDANEDHFLWQSFDYPCDTLLPGMKLGWNLVTGLDRYISSWKSEDDPAMGEYFTKIDPRGYPQVFESKGSVLTTRLGPWNGIGFATPSVQPQKTYRNVFVLNEKEVYYEFKLLNKSIFTIVRETPSGSGQRVVWTSQTMTPQVIDVALEDVCDNYGFCGANSMCNTYHQSQICECLKGFVPQFPDQWSIGYWFNGCVRRTALDCDKKYGFWRYTGVKVPDTSSSWYNMTTNLEECQKLCLKNCSCISYANLDIRNGGSGCLLWFNRLIDMRQVSQGGQDFYFRVLASDLDEVADNGHSNIRKKLLRIAVGIIAFGFTICVCIMILKKRGVARIIYWKHYRNKLRKEDIDLPTFDLSIITRATENFSSSNKLGEGGFGPVYKGTLSNGQELAVKRLSKKSVQGLEEFKNEVVSIAKHQHRNLVKLLGCCIQGEEKMLIYEYMPNKSLDYFIFDETRKKLIDWHKRFSIIGGIARGLLYLHQDSRLRIIHRDLKPSNVLLDANLEPKISDFGLARIFLGDQVEADTNRVAGTYGYMPPEYAVHGHFSMKSDIFSYGVIVLEIISGKKNREFSDPEHYLNLLGHAWTLWTAERPLELVDGVLGGRCTSAEVIRCIQVGLLCVQQRPEDRPDMSSVVLMLNGEKSLPKPKIPGFYSDRDIAPEADSSSTKNKLFSPNEISITMLDAR